MPPSARLSDLPPAADMETRPVLKALSVAHRRAGRNSYYVNENLLRLFLAADSP